MQIIKTATNREYEILDQKGDYTLLKETKPIYDKITEFVVAYGFNENCWLQGHYIYSEKAAIDLFNQKTT